MQTYSTKPEIHVEVWSGNHPFWTGQQRFVDTEGRVENSEEVRRNLRQKGRRETLSVCTKGQVGRVIPARLILGPDR